jgi:hypothetical protein
MVSAAKMNAECDSGGSEYDTHQKHTQQEAGSAGCRFSDSGEVG